MYNIADRDRIGVVVVQWYKRVYVNATVEFDFYFRE